jgi:hypothetical protein
MKMAAAFPEKISGNGWNLVCTYWERPNGTDQRIYIKSASTGKDMMYYSIDSRAFASLRTWNKRGDREEVEQLFLDAYLSMPIQETPENAETMEQRIAAENKAASNRVDHLHAEPRAQQQYRGLAPADFRASLDHWAQTYKATQSPDGLVYIRPYAPISGMAGLEAVVTYNPADDSFTWRSRAAFGRDIAIEQAYRAFRNSGVTGMESDPTDMFQEEYVKNDDGDFVPRWKAQHDL